MKHFTLESPEPDFEDFLDTSFGPLPSAEEELDEIESEVRYDSLVNQTNTYKVLLHYTNIHKGNPNCRVKLQIQKKWYSFNLSQIALNKTDKTVLIAVAVCKQKNIRYNPEEVIQ